MPSVVMWAPSPSRIDRSEQGEQRAMHGEETGRTAQPAQQQLPKIGGKRRFSRTNPC
jgi:hypothetical protein